MYHLSMETQEIVTGDASGAENGGLGLVGRREACFSLKTLCTV